MELWLWKHVERNDLSAEEENLKRAPDQHSNGWSRSVIITTPTTTMMMTVLKSEFAAAFFCSTAVCDFALVMSVCIN